MLAQLALPLEYCKFTKRFSNQKKPLIYNTAAARLGRRRLRASKSAPEPSQYTPEASQHTSEAPQHTLEAPQYVLKSSQYALDASLAIVNSPFKKSDSLLELIDFYNIDQFASMEARDILSDDEPYHPQPYSDSYDELQKEEHWLGDSFDTEFDAAFDSIQS